MRKVCFILLAVLSLIILSGCGVPLGILGAICPENKTIQNLQEADFAVFEEVFPIKHRDCVINHMNMCYGNDSSCVDGEVRTDGFYYFPKKHERKIGDSIYYYDSEDPWGQEIYRVAFYSDWMFGGQVWIVNGNSGAGEWGMFKIHNDTIITECMTRGSMNGSSYGFRDTLIIKSTDTLVLLSRTAICPEFLNHENYFHYYRGERGDELYFMPFDSLPNPDESWIKKKKWFWCDENEWKQYKRQKEKRIIRTD